jgi:hypothetical protein
MRLFYLIALLCCELPTLAQIRDPNFAFAQAVENDYLLSISDKSEKITRQLRQKTSAYLAEFARQEQKLKKKLTRKDSSAAKLIFQNAESYYAVAQRKINKTGELFNRTSHYLPWLDSATTTVKFLESSSSVAGATVTNSMKNIKVAAAKLNELKEELRNAEDMKAFLKDRKIFLSEQLQRYNLGNALKGINQTAYYYGLKVNEYRHALQDPSKIERKVLQLLNRIPAFTFFMKKNSVLASLFRVVPDDPTDPNYLQNLAGLQTRADVSQLLQSQTGNSTIADLGALSANLQSAEAQLINLKDRVLKYGSANPPEDVPLNKINNQKTKSFFNRLEYGTNIQTNKSNYFFPTTTDMGLSIGYKLSNKSLLGVGISYKMGWGKDIQHINITSEGLGLRSFLDVKLKGTVYLSGGMEYNYQQVFSSLQDLYVVNCWQQSGLLGVSKIISTKTKLFKKTKLQLLWDMLSYKQMPKAQAFKFRVGYNF